MLVKSAILVALIGTSKPGIVTDRRKCFEMRQAGNASSHRNAAPSLFEDAVNLRAL
jgi:hypothetical protein